MNLPDRALAYGIQPTYENVGGQECEAPPQTLEKLLQAFEADRHPPLERAPRLEAPKGAQCLLPQIERCWGIALQLYQLRSDRNWGIGDFADLAELARHAASSGADFLGLNPLHALFLSKPAHCSPFSPSNRRFLNPLYMAVDGVPGFLPEMVDETRLEHLRHADLVDYLRYLPAPSWLLSKTSWKGSARTPRPRA